MGFSRQEYWIRLPCPPPGDLIGPGIKPGSPAFQIDSLDKFEVLMRQTGWQEAALGPGRVSSEVR